MLKKIAFPVAKNDNRRRFDWWKTANAGMHEPHSSVISIHLPNFSTKSKILNEWSINIKKIVLLVKKI